MALNVTVLDQHKRFVGGLGPENFAAHDNGVPQELAFFAFADVQLDLALLLDLSSSMIDKMDFVREAATGFLRTLRSQDRAMAIGFTNTMRVLHPLTADIARVEVRFIRRGRTARQPSMTRCTSLSESSSASTGRTSTFGGRSLWCFPTGSIQ